MFITPGKILDVILKMNRLNIKIMGISETGCINRETSKIIYYLGSRAVNTFMGVAVILLLKISYPALPVFYFYNSRNTVEHYISSEYIPNSGKTMRKWNFSTRTMIVS